MKIRLNGKRLPQFVAGVALAVGGLLAGRAWAANPQLVWTGGGDGTKWSDAANWNVTPNWSEANDLDFTALAGGTTIHNDATTRFGAVTFGEGKGTIVWTADKIAAPTDGKITIPTGTTVDARFKVGNYWGWDGWRVTVTGRGTLWLNAVWTGDYSGGKLTLDGVAAALKVGLNANGSGELALKNGARATAEKSFTTCRLTSESAADRLALDSGVTATVKRAAGTFAGALAGAGAFTLRGGETWTLSGDSPDFTGTLRLRETRVNVTGSLGAQTKVVNEETGTLVVARDQTVAAVSGNAAVGGVEIADGKTLTVTDGGAYGARLSGAGTLALDAPGKALTLSGANALTGTVRVKSGTLVAADTSGTALSGYPAGLVSRYSFDSDLTTDDLGANDLKVSEGAPVAVADGLGGSRAVRFDGASRMQTTANTFIKERAPFTISFWVRTDKTDTWTNRGNFLHLGNWTETTENVVIMGAASADGYALGSLLTLQGHYVWQRPWQDGAWRQYALTFDGSVLKLYANGQDTEKDETRYWNLANTALYIGTRVTADYDELLVFNRALSADEVKELYENPFPAPTAEAAAHPAPIARWAFNDAENPGKDTSGNGSGLEVVGGTLSLTSDADDYGSAARFTKDGAYMKLSGTGLPANFPSGRASFTVNVRLSGTGGAQGLDLFSMGDVTTAGKFFRISNGNYPRRLGYSWKNKTSEDPEKQTSDGILANSYVTSTFVYDADAMTLTCYQDGYRVNSESNVTPDIAADGTVYIAYNPVKGSRFECKLDDVQVFAAALNAAQVRRLVQSLETGAVPGVVAASSVSVDAGATFYTPASASVAGLSGSGAVAVGAHGTLASASASGFTGTVFGPGAFALAENAVLNCTRDTPALDMTGTLTLPTVAMVCFAETEERISEDTRHSYVVARATSLAGATDLSGWTCKLNGTVTDKVTFKIKGGTVLAKVRRGLVFLIK